MRAGGRRGVVAWCEGGASVLSMALAARRLTAPVARRPVLGRLALLLLVLVDGVVVLVDGVVVSFKITFFF